MAAYYNENDAYCAQWLRNLIAEGFIARGDVDERSIRDVKPDDLRGYEQCHFFAGIGGWSLALRLAGWPDDRFVWTGSCPCQPFSAAGKGWGVADDRHLWPAWVYLIKERAPSIVFGEQVASAVTWLRLVRSDLEALGYAVGAIPIEAACAGADHLRNRFWFVGHHDGAGRADNQEMYARGRLASGGARENPAASGHGGALDLADAERSVRGRGASEPKRKAERRTSFDGASALDLGEPVVTRLEGHAWNGDDTTGRTVADRSASTPSAPNNFAWAIGADGKARRVKPGIRLLANGVPCRVAKLRAFGNAVYPPVAAEFIKAAMK